MSDTDNERPLAPGIARAMHDARHATDLSHRHRHRWSLPSDHSTPDEDTGTDVE